MPHQLTIAAHKPKPFIEVFLGVFAFVFILLDELFYGFDVPGLGVVVFVELVVLVEVDLR